MAPKFAVGEVVILQSRDLPQCNGEHVVRKVVLRDAMTEDRVHPAGLIKRIGGPIGYILEEVIPLGEGNDGLPCEAVWNESALRKKHQPGELSFDKLMSSLSQPVQEPSYT